MAFFTFHLHMPAKEDVLGITIMVEGGKLPSLLAMA